jgi:sulfite exporter TauE/SafE
MARNRRALGLLLIVVALFAVTQQFGLLNMLVPSKLATTGMGYGLIFVIGVVTSVHCLAMCGGINLSQSLARPLTQPSKSASASKAPAPSGIRAPLLYNLGRVASYTAIGALVGALGTAISLTPTIQGTLKLVAGVLMIFMGLTMMGAFPSLHRLLPRPPKALTQHIDEQKERSKSPLYVGLLNGLMPCGPLQAMQLYALSTGSALAGALSMLTFALGTVPLVLGLGILATTLGKRFTRQVMTAGAVLVLVLGLAMLSQGLSLANIAIPFFSASLEAQREAQNGTGTTVVERNGLPPIENGIQIIDSTLEPSRYPQITVQTGVPVRWVINASEESINGCNSRVLIPEYRIEHSFEPGQNVIEFTPVEPGRYSYSCWMGMIRSSIVVVEA